MDRVLLAAVVAALLVGQSGVVAATADDGTVASPNDRTIETSTDGLSALVYSTIDLQPRVGDALAVTVPASVPDLLPPTLLLGYSRHDGSDPLAHDTRRAIYETVDEEPGTHLSALAGAIGEPESTVRYHVRVLEEESLVETAFIRGRRRVFQTGVSDRRLAVAMADDGTAPVLAAVDRSEPVSISSLAEALDRSPSTVSYHVSRLAGDGLVNRERNGQEVRVSLTKAGRQRPGDE